MTPLLQSSLATTTANEIPSSPAPSCPAHDKAGDSMTPSQAKPAPLPASGSPKPRLWRSAAPLKSGKFSVK